MCILLTSEFLPSQLLQGELKSTALIFFNLKFKTLPCMFLRFHTLLISNSWPRFFINSIVDAHTHIYTHTHKYHLLSLFDVNCVYVFTGLHLVLDN